MKESYSAAKKRGLREVKQAKEEGRSPYPEVLDEILKDEGKLAEIPIGLMEIPLDMIAGTKTKGRTNSFSCGFMPILDEGTEFSDKWSDLFDSQMSVGIRDPIKVYEYMTRFYVEEGNKRVSVSRYVGSTDIYANVIRVMPTRKDTPEYRLYREFLTYFGVAGMYEVTFSKEGSYQKFARCLGRTLDEKWPKTLIQDIKAAYAVFTQVYGQKREKNWSGLSDGDAFLVYLNVYPLESLLDDPRSILNERLDRIWGEFLVDSREDNITLLENPEDAEKQEKESEAASLGNIGNALRGILQPGERPWQRSFERIRDKNRKTYTKENPLHMAFLYPKNPEDSSWIYGHELGRSNLEGRFDGIVKTKRYDGCNSDEAIRNAVKQAVDDHAEMIFTLSPTQMEETLRCAILYPDVKFLNCSVNLTHRAVRTYYGRIHEAKFLMGALAASVTENHKIGYVADYPIYGIVSGINAFAIGASLVDPWAEIVLKWSTDKDRDWKKEFEEEKIDVISGPDFKKPADESREYGIYRRMNDGSVVNLAAPVWDWGRYYELIAWIVLNGRWDIGNQKEESRAVNYWWGMSSGVIDVILSEKIPYSMHKLMDMLKDGIVSGRFDPFMGELHSQEGIVRDRNSRGLSSSEIITMNWLNDNVVGSLPKQSELNEEAGAAVEVSGVEGVADDTSKLSSSSLGTAGMKTTKTLDNGETMDTGIPQTHDNLPLYNSKEDGGEV